MQVVENPPHYVLKVPAARKKDIASLMALRGLQFSVSASSKSEAVLFSSNPYAVADLADAEAPGLLSPLKKAIEASRQDFGVGTTRLPPGKELWAYQKGTLDYLLSRGGGINGDSPGLGKTPTSIAYCNEREATRVLVIVPASLRLQWKERIEEWSTIPRVKVAAMLKVKDGIHPTAHYQIVSYDACRNPAIVRAITKYKWDVMICDEAHKMKSAEAATTRAILGNAKGIYHRGEHKIPAIASAVKESLALTGTLLLNRPSEAFVLFRFFDHEAIDFMTEEQFKTRYNRQADLKTVEGKRFKLESTSLESELQNRLRAHVMARHEKLEVLKHLKPPRYSVVRCEEDGAVREALEAENLLEIDAEDFTSKKSIEVLGHIAEARRLMGIALAPQIADYAQVFLDGSDEKLAIFCWHLEVLDIFQETLADFGVVRIDGSKTPKQREAATSAFVNDPNVRVFIGNIQSAGTGLDGLQTVCSKCFIAEPDWVPAQNEQAVSRLDRIGQKGVVSAEIFVAPGSISERILKKALEKLNVIHRVMDQRENS